MVTLDNPLSTYFSEIEAWHQKKENELRADDGWLTLAGLHWLHEGINTLGSDPICDVVLPFAGIPKVLGTITLADGQTRLQITADEPVTIDGIPAHEGILRNDAAKNGASLVSLHAVSFFVINRDDLLAVRVRDRNNPARVSFEGRRWFPVNLNYRVTARFTLYPTPREVQVVNSVGQISPMSLVGRADMTLQGQSVSLEAFDAAEKGLWFIFKDASSGPLTYKAGRFMYAPLLPDGSVQIDFNQAYHPPCAFTPYATCPLPPKENKLTISIEAGERL